jgi:hypothetical protein
MDGKICAKSRDCAYLPWQICASSEHRLPKKGLSVFIRRESFFWMQSARESERNAENTLKWNDRMHNYIDWLNKTQRLTYWDEPLCVYKCGRTANSPTSAMQTSSSILPISSEADEFSFKARSNFGWRMKSSGSIDDFLADYSHEDVSIEEFLSCLEDTHIEQRNTSSIFNSARSHTVQPIHTTDTVHPSALNSTSKRKLSVLVKEEQETKIVGEVPVSKPCPADGGRETRHESLSDSREEVRRRKNREYQRRFREKRMRLELQKEASSLFHQQQTSSTQLPVSNHANYFSSINRQH